jgi:hypothetical protein
MLRHPPPFGTSCPKSGKMPIRNSLMADGLASSVRTRKCHIAHQSPPRIVAIPIPVAAEASLGVTCIKPPPSAWRRGLCAHPPFRRMTPPTPLPSPPGPVGCPSGIYSGEGQNAGFPSTGPVGGLCGKRNVRDLAPTGGESSRSISCNRAATRWMPRLPEAFCLGLCEPAMTGIWGGLLCACQTFGQRGYHRAERVGPGARRPVSRARCARRSHPYAAVRGAGADHASRRGRCVLPPCRRTTGSSASMPFLHPSSNMRRPVFRSRRGPPSTG